MNRIFDHHSRKNILVQSGEVKFTNKNIILSSSGIGSCIIVIFYDIKKRMGALAHIMLPGSAPKKNSTQKAKYAGNAIKKSLTGMFKYDADINNIIACVLGGANVLEKKNDEICRANISSVLNYLKMEGINIKRKSLGGVKRRTVWFDVGKGEIYYSLGDSKPSLLWRKKVI